MTAFASHDDSSATGFSAASYAEEHLTMHQFMYETTAADPTSFGFLTVDQEGGQHDDQDPAARVAPRVRIRIYP
jgi:hypothetical protein